MTAATRMLLATMVANPDAEFYSYGLAQVTGINGATIVLRLRHLEQLGWLTSRLEDEAAWRAGAPPGCGPGSRRRNYRFTTDGLRAALRQLEGAARKHSQPVPDPR